MKNVNILKDLNTLNKLHASSVESYTTNNGIVDFTCDNAGYVDNVAIEGKTLVNLFSFKKTESSNNNSVWVHINTDYISLFKKVEYTLINTSDKNILVDIYSNDTNSYKRNLLIKANSSIKDTLTSNEHYSKCTGLFSDSWSLSDLSVISSTLIILEGDHTDKPISYFEGLKSAGQGDNIEVLTREHNKTNLLKSQNVTYKDNYMIAYASGLESASNNHKYTETYIEIEPNTDYCFYHASRNICWYDENKNFILQPLSERILGENMNKDLFFSAKSPSNAKYLRVTIIKAIHNNGKTSEIYKGKYDKKQISTTLRSLPNGVKDTIEKRGNKYVKVQRCGEVTLNGNEQVGMYISNGNTAVFGVIHKGQIHKRGLGICDKLRYHMVFNTGEEHFYLETDNTVNIEISLSKLSSANEEGLKTWLKSNPTTVVYELATPQIIELPNFNLQTYKGENTLIVNSGVIQCDVSFDVCEGIRSELDVIKDKVSSLDDYESGYEFSNEVIYLNGTYKPGFAETPYIVRIGKICILHCAIGNDAPQRGMHVLKLPSFAKPKDHHRCAGRAKINDETINPILVDYDITLDNTVQIWTTHETTKLNEMYIHMIWEVE